MSVEWLLLKKTAAQRHSERFFARTREMTNNWDRENFACTRIQRLWRGYNARKYIAFLNDQATEIERVWRGYLGRERAHTAHKARKTELERQYFDCMATLIQKVFRGYRSRKDKQDFYRRKDYVSTVTKQSISLNDHITRNIHNLNAYLDDKRIVGEAKEFTELTENLHHLLGTKNRPGVFASAIGPEFHTTAYGLPLEDHIQDAFENRRTRHRLQVEEEKVKREKERRGRRKEARAIRQIRQAQQLDGELQMQHSSGGNWTEVDARRFNSSQPRAARAPPVMDPTHVGQISSSGVIMGETEAVMIGYPPQRNTPTGRSLYGSNPNNNGSVPRRRVATPPQLQPLDRTGSGRRHKQRPNYGQPTQKLAEAEATIIRQQPRLVPMAQ